MGNQPFNSRQQFIVNMSSSQQQQSFQSYRRHQPGEDYYYMLAGLSPAPSEPPRDAIPIDDDTHCPVPGSQGVTKIRVNASEESSVGERTDQTEFIRPTPVVRPKPRKLPPRPRPRRLSLYTHASPVKVKSPTSSCSAAPSVDSLYAELTYPLASSTPEKTRDDITIFEPRPHSPPAPWSLAPLPPLPPRCTSRLKPRPAEQVKSAFSAVDPSKNCDVEAVVFDVHKWSRAMDLCRGLRVNAKSDLQRLEELRRLIVSAMPRPGWEQGNAATKANVTTPSRPVQYLSYQEISVMSNDDCVKIIQDNSKFLKEIPIAILHNVLLELRYCSQEAFTKQQDRIHHG